MNTVMKTLVKSGKRIKGFVYTKADGSCWYAFGKPSQAEYIEFKCRSIEHGIACIESSSLIEYAIKKDGKYLSGLFPIAFEVDKPEKGKIYFFYIKETAEDIARQLDAEIEVL